MQVAKGACRIFEPLQELWRAIFSLLGLGFSHLGPISTFEIVPQAQKMVDFWCSKVRLQKSAKFSSARPGLTDWALGL